MLRHFKPSELNVVIILLATSLLLPTPEIFAATPTVDQLLKTSQRKDDDRTPTASLEQLVVAMHNNSGQAAADLGLLGDPRAIDPLIAELRNRETDDYQRTLNAALQSLGQIGDPRAVPVLVSWLDKKITLPTSRYRCRIVADALAALGDPGLDALLERLNDTPDPVPIAVASALGKQKNRRAVTPLLSAMDKASEKLYLSPQRKLFLAAVASLGHLGDTRAVEPLVRHLDNIRQGRNYHSLEHRQDLAIAIIADLAEIGDARAVPILTTKRILYGPPDVRRATVMALSRIDAPDVVPSLIEALQDNDPELRRYAAIGLCHGDTRAIEPLRKALDDKDASVRCRAAASLARLHTRLGSELASQEDMGRLRHMIEKRPLVAVGEFADNSAWKHNHHRLAVPEHFRANLVKRLAAAGYEVDLVPSGFQPSATMSGAITTYCSSYTPLTVGNMLKPFLNGFLRLGTMGMFPGYDMESKLKGSMEVTMAIVIDGKTHRRTCTSRARHKTSQGLIKELADKLAKDVSG